MPQFDIQGKVALVNGANRGIGKELVHALCRAGVGKVYAAVRQVESVAPLVEQYGSSVILPLPMDLSDLASIQATAAQATDVQVVINNAGVLTSSHFPLEKEAIANLEFELIATENLTVDSDPE